MDADNSHDPALILKMLAAADAGVVIASRFQPGGQTIGVPARRRLLSRMASLLLSTVFPTPHVRDFTCGFRGYRAEVLQSALDAYGEALFESDGFQCMVDLLLKVRALGVQFAEVPIVLRYDLKRGSSKMPVWRTIRSTLRLVVRRRLNL
jgi:dolichol-phosphate mannosyltransferase